MNILYLSRIFGCPWGGPTHSVPAQIVAQSKYDNVLWYNIVDSEKSNWKDTLLKWKEFIYYHDLNDFKQETIKDLPRPFNKPDLIVVEQFYKFAKSKIVRELIKDNHKYIIIPRGELAADAQKQKALKKKIFNFIYFNKFAKSAIAIQYLTEREKNDSSSKWNRRLLVIPNGTYIPDTILKKKHSQGIEAISIGRIAVFHKGIDLLIEACALVRDELMDKSFRITLYGPDEDSIIPKLHKKIEDLKLENIILFGAPVQGENKKSILLNADIFIMTSRFEGHPTGLLEALAYGLPSLVTTGSNMRKEIEAKDAGWGADNTADSISAALEQMTRETDRFRNKGKNAIDLSKQYSWQSVAQKSHVEYNSLINKKGKI